MEKIKKITQSKIFIKTLKIILIVLILCLVFQLGMFVGFKKASFSFRVGGNYFKQMQGRPNDPIMGMRGGEFANPHGSVGKIVKISLPNLIIEDRDNTEKTISIGNDTVLKGIKKDIKINDLKEGDMVMVIGNPNDDGVQIEAKLVRILPPPPSDTFLSSTSANNNLKNK
jgi:hypothetical protein